MKSYSLSRNDYHVYFRLSIHFPRVSLTPESKWEVNVFNLL